MKKIKLMTILLLIILTIFSTISLSHSGRTDSNGGHNSPSGYHYHHGYSAHQHYNGICPYDYIDNTQTTSSTNLIYNNANNNLNTGKIKSLNTTVYSNTISNTSTTSFSFIKNHSISLCILFFIITGIIEIIYDKITFKNKSIITTENKSQNNTAINNNKSNTEIRSTYNYYKCPRCNSILRIKYGKYGRFIGCSNYPKCKYTRNFK